MAQVEMLESTQEFASEILAKDREHLKHIQTAYHKDFPTLMLLEAAPVPLVKSRPKRTLIVVASVMVAFVFSVIGVIIFDTYRDVDWKKVLHI